MELLHQLTLQSRYEEVARVEELLNSIQEDLGIDNELYAKMMLAVSEAVTNGIVHGNELKETKQVKVKAFLNASDNKLIIETKDEGSGFNPDKLSNPISDENLLKTSGRGVFLMREYADEVIFSEGGTKIQLMFQLNND